MDKIINERVLNLFDNNFLDFQFDNIKLKYDTKKLLKDYQFMHVADLKNSIQNNNIALDCSSTGTGKTFTSIAVCKELNLKPIIICTKSNIINWFNICRKFGVEPTGVSNYESIRNCKIFNKDLKSEKCFFLTKNLNDEFKWNIKNPKNTILIFDEVHKCKNNKSILGKLLISSKHQCKILMISATVCDKPNDFMIFGYMLGFYNRIKQFQNWIKNLIKEDNIDLKKKNSLNKLLFPDKGSRMLLDDIKHKLPKNNIIFDCYYVNTDDLNKINDNLIVIKKDKINNFNNITKNRQNIEKIKIPIIYDEIIKYNELSCSIVVFINFIDTLNEISNKLNKDKLDFSIIKGNQSIDDRHKNIELFQINKNKIILCMIQCGGESINLNDKVGKYPRISLISPSLSSIDLLQAIGRSYRTDSKSNCIQKIIFCANTYEEKISKILKKKNDFINQLCDEDLISF